MHVREKMGGIRGSLASSPVSRPEIPPALGRDVDVLIDFTRAVQLKSAWSVLSAVFRLHTSPPFTQSPCNQKETD